MLLCVALTMARCDLTHDAAFEIFAPPVLTVVWDVHWHVDVFEAVVPVEAVDIAEDAAERGGAGTDEGNMMGGNVSYVSGTGVEFRSEAAGWDVICLPLTSFRYSNQSVVAAIRLANTGPRANKMCG